MTVADSPAYLSAPSVDSSYVAVRQAARDVLGGMIGQGVSVTVEGRRAIEAGDVASLAKNVLVELQFERPADLHHGVVVLADASELIALFALTPPEDGEIIAAESLLSLGDIVSTFLDSVVGEFVWLQPAPRAWLANMEPIELDASGAPRPALPALTAGESALYLVDITLSADDGTLCACHVIFGEKAEKALLGLDEPGSDSPHDTGTDADSDGDPSMAFASAASAGSTPPDESWLTEDEPAPHQAQPSVPTPPVQPAQFKPLGPDQAGNRGQSIDLIRDVPLRVSVELGRASLTVREILGLGPGSVVQLDRLAGEPVDILVNDRLIAHGEVVIVDESFGVRLTEIVRESGRRGQQ